MAAFRRTDLSWLALLALALQLVLSFGHAHVHAPQSTLQHSALQSAAPNSAGGRDFAPDQAHPSQNSPTQNNHDDEQHCSICLAVAISGALVLAAPLLLPMPSLEAAPQRAPGILGHLHQRSSFTFRARGPPSPTTVR